MRTPRLSTLSATAFLEQILASSPIASLASPGRPRLQLSENETGVIARLELPGFSKDQIDIVIEKDVVIVSSKKEQAQPDNDQQSEPSDNAERVIYTEFLPRAFSRSFRLGFEIAAGEATAKMQDGVLCIELPKSEGAIRKTLSID